MARPALHLRGSVAVSILIAVAGCDSAKDRADRKVNQQVDSAVAALEAKPDDAEKASKNLGDAAGDTAASLPTQIKAQVLHGHDELRLGQEVAARVSANTVVISHLAAGIRQDAATIADNTTSYESLKQSDPAAVEAVVKKTATLVKGSDEQSQWYTSDDGNIPSEAAVDKQIADVQGQIDRLETRIKADTDEKNTTTVQADQLMEQSKQEKRQKSVDLYTQGRQLRQKADDLGTQVEVNTSKRNRLAADLTVLKVQKEQAAAALKQLDTQTEELTARRTELNTQQAGIAKRSSDLLGTAGESVKLTRKYGSTILPEGDRSTIHAKAALMEALVAENKGLADTADRHINAAIEAYSKAVSMAGTLDTELSQRVSGDGAQRQEAGVIRQRREAMSPMTFKWFQGDAELRRATFLADRTAELRARQAAFDAASDALKKADLHDLPSGLVDPGPDVDTKEKETDKAFTTAVTTLKDVMEGDTTQSRKSGAQVEEALGHYLWALHLAPAMSEAETKDPKSLDPQRAGQFKASDGHLAEAISKLKVAAQPGTYLPPLPADLMEPAAPMVKPPTTLPKR